MSFAYDVIWSVWSKGQVAGGNDPLLWRVDECSAWIFRSDYENRDSEYGWLVDHIIPVSEGGTDDIENLRPLNWQNTSRTEKGDLICQVTAEGIHNKKTQKRTA